MVEKKLFEEVPVAEGLPAKTGYYFTNKGYCRFVKENPNSSAHWINDHIKPSGVVVNVQWWLRPISAEQVYKSMHRTVKPTRGEALRFLEDIDDLARELNSRDYGIPLRADEKITEQFVSLLQKWTVWITQYSPPMEMRNNEITNDK